MTSAELLKEIKRYQDEQNNLLDIERKTDEFVVPEGGDVEGCRPNYDFVTMQSKLKAVENKIIELKTKLELFTVTYVLPGYDMTISQARMYKKILSDKTKKLKAMSTQADKVRVINKYNTSCVEYRYLNYGPDVAKKAYEDALAELDALQFALDRVNYTVDIETGKEV